MGFTMNSLQIETVTPDKAREYLGYNYAHNRPLRQTWVKHLANEMSEGRFMPTAEIHVMYCNGEPVLVNGQHTCNAIALYGKPVRATVRKSSTTEHGQVAMMYSFGHDNGIKRTPRDGLSAYNIGEELDLGSQRINDLAAALRHIRLGFRGEGEFTKATPMPLPETIERMHEWVIYARMFWGELSKDTIKTTASKRGSLSVAMVTYRYQYDNAKLFWNGILAPDGLAWNDPRVVARRAIEDSKGTRGVRSLSSGILSRQLARCWRGFVNGEMMAQKPKQIDAAAAIVIVGTPYNGRQPAPPWWPDED